MDGRSGPNPDQYTDVIELVQKRTAQTVQTQTSTSRVSQTPALHSSESAPPSPLTFKMF